MSRYFLIGGKTVESNYFEKTLLSLVDKKRPKLLFFPTASKDSEKIIERFHSNFTKLDVEIIDILLYKNDYDVDKLFESADIIYFSGGNTKKLVEKLKEKNIDKYLEKYKDSNIIFAGVSAGAILFSSDGMGDSESYINNQHTYNFKMVKGLGILDISICPHYQKEDLYIFNDIAKEKNISYGLENDTAILIDKDNLKVYKADKKASVYKFDSNSKEFIKALY